MTNLFINLVIRDGERTYEYKVIHHTKCNNLEFAVQYYAAHFWGYSELDGSEWIAWSGEIAISVDSWKIIPNEDLKILNKYMI